MSDAPGPSMKHDWLDDFRKERMTGDQQETWVSMTEAAKQLGIPNSSFSRLVKRLAETGHPVHTRRDVLNKTIILVNVDEIREALKNRYQE